MGTEPGRVEKVGDPLPWDVPTADPADGDLFEMLELPADERLTLARIEAAAILNDPPPDPNAAK